jgi:hypothetical protein
VAGFAGEKMHMKQLNIINIMELLLIKFCSISFLLKQNKHAKKSKKKPLGPREGRQSISKGCMAGGQPRRNENLGRFTLFIP